MPRGMISTFRSVLVAAALVPTLAVVAAPAQAQNSIGVVAGFNAANLSFDPTIRKVYAEAFGFDARNSGVNGLAAGVSFERPLVGRLGVRAEGLFSPAGTTIEGSASNDGIASTFEDTIKLSMLEVPVTAVFHLDARGNVRLMGGGFLARTFNQKETTHSTQGGMSRDIELDADHQAQIKNMHVGIALGAEVKLTPRVRVGGRFNLGLTNLDGDDDFDSIKMRIIRIYVVLRLK